MTEANIQRETPFSQLIAAMRTRGDEYTIDLPADWLQGRTAYGGLSASLCLEAALRAHIDLPPLRSAQFCFIGPATGIPIARWSNRSRPANGATSCCCNGPVPLAASIECQL